MSIGKKIGMVDEFQTFEQRAIIKVCGIGGGGGNAVGRMIDAGLDGVDFIAINTDSQDLRRSPAGTRIQIGRTTTGGLGSGAKPEVGRSAAEEDRERLEEALRGADMVFLTAGLGGGTGTGATPIVAEVASATGALTVGIVTLPFSFEGVERRQNAMKGLKALEEHVDSLIVVPNDRLAELTQNLSFLNAFEQADEILHNGVRAISEIIMVSGLVNVDFADVETIMRGGGRTLMGIGNANGDQRARRAAEEAMVCPLLEQSTIEGAMGVIVNIRGGHEIGMREVLDAVSTVRNMADPNANIIFGAIVEEEEREDLQVTVIASRFPMAASDVSDTSNLKLDNIEKKRADIEQGVAQKSQLKAAAAQNPPAREIPPEPVAQEPEPELADDPFREPEIQDMLPLEEKNAADTPEPGTEDDSDEDMGIPAFMRRRMRARRQNPQ